MRPIGSPPITTSPYEPSWLADTAIDRLKRRSLSWSLLLVATILWYAVLPFSTAFALVRDLRHRDTRWGSLRTIAFISVYAIAEWIAIVVLSTGWLGAWATPRRHRERTARWVRRIQGWWGSRLSEIAYGLFGLVPHIEGLDEVPDGPFLLFTRHAGGGDTLAPMYALTRTRGTHLRYVLKQELRFAPAFELACSWSPAHFVNRRAKDPEAEAQRVAHVADGMQAGECLVIYPEGTRFTDAKRQRILDRATASSDPTELTRVEPFTHVLPPRKRGPLALLDRHPELDVLFFAHVGLEHTDSLHDLWNGRCAGQPMAIRMWRVRAADILRDPDARAAWLDVQWRRMNAEVRDLKERYPEV